MLKNEQNEVMLPKVLFIGLETPIVVGQCLNMIDERLNTIKSPVLKRLLASKKKLDDVEQKLAYILSLTGIDCDEICVISQCDNNPFLIKIHLEHAQLDGTILFMNRKSGNETVVVRFYNEERVYDYHESSRFKIIDFKLKQYTIKGDNNDTLVRYLSESNAKFVYDTRDYTVTLNVYRPKDGDDSVLQDSYMLKNENELVKIFFSLTFPVDINALYKAIYRTALGDITIYPTFCLKVEKKKGNKKDKVTDMISLNKGQLVNYVITTDKKIISIDGEGNWSHESSNLAVSKRASGEISYKMETGQDTIKEASLPVREFELASSEVAKVKRLIDRIYNK